MKHNKNQYIYTRRYENERFKLVITVSFNIEII